MCGVRKPLRARGGSFAPGDTPYLGLFQFRLDIESLNARAPSIIGLSLGPPKIRIHAILSERKNLLVTLKSEFLLTYQI